MDHCASACQAGLSRLLTAQVIIIDERHGSLLDHRVIVCWNFVRRDWPLFPISAGRGPRVHFWQHNVTVCCQRSLDNLLIHLYWFIITI